MMLPKWSFDLKFHPFSYHYDRYSFCIIKIDINNIKIDCFCDKFIYGIIRDRFHGPGVIKKLVMFNNQGSIILVS